MLQSFRVSIKVSSVIGQEHESRQNPGQALAKFCHTGMSSCMNNQWYDTSAASGQNFAQMPWPEDCGVGFRIDFNVNM